MQKICVDFEFDEDKIEDYLKTYAIEEKYKGIPAFEWHQTKTREQKAHERKKAKLDEERKQRQVQREIAIRARKELQRIEREKRSE